MVAENDANLAMIGEQWQGSARDRANAVLLDVCENGFGAGLIVNGALVRGSNGFAGEMTSVDLLSGMGPAGGAAAQDRAARGRGPPRVGGPRGAGRGDPANVTTDMVLKAGDAVSARVIDEVGAIVARPIAMLATLLDPELVVICGLPADAAARLMLPAIETQTAALYRRLAAPLPSWPWPSSAAGRRCWARSGALWSRWRALFGTSPFPSA